jgi:hypothetical protein
MYYIIIDDTVHALEKERFILYRFVLFFAWFYHGQWDDTDPS